MTTLRDLLEGDAGRLFDGECEPRAPDGFDPDRHEGFVVGRLLEEGTSDDLHRLAKAVPEERWRTWLGREGGFGLSDRSRVFWTLLLAGPSAEAPAPPALRREIWPL